MELTAAQMIRKELKSLFPSIKFSVRSDHNSVRISYKNGPVEQDVQNHLDKYQYGSFNGMEDIYENDNCRDDIPQVKWVFVNRHITEDIYQAFFDYCKEYYAMFENVTSMEDSLGNHHGYVNTFLGREIRKFDLTNGLTFN